MELSPISALTLEIPGQCSNGLIVAEGSAESYLEELHRADVHSNQHTPLWWR